MEHDENVTNLHVVPAHDQTTGQTELSEPLYELPGDIRRQAKLNFRLTWHFGRGMKEQMRMLEIGYRVYRKQAKSNGLSPMDVNIFYLNEGRATRRRIIFKYFKFLFAGIAVSFTTYAAWIAIVQYHAA
ncbi:MAG: hypothetical protein AAGA72_18395 [Pseudomonadota bacterium]